MIELTRSRRARTARPLKFCSLLLVCTCTLSAATERGSTWYYADFNSTSALRGWTGEAKLVPAASPPQDAPTNYFVAISSTRAGSVITRPLDPVAVRGCVVRGTVRVRAEGVSEKPNPWNGIKCMLVIDTPAGREYPQAPIDTGAFDWREAKFTARIPAQATNVTLVLGLEQVRGNVCFDDVRFVVTRLPITRPAPVAGPMYRGHNLPGLRGAMISSSINEEALVTLGRDWNANLIRWQLIRTGRAARENTPEAYDQWIQQELRKLDAALPFCEKFGLYVVLDLHSPPGGQPTAGGYAGSDAGLFTNKDCQDRFVALWESMASRYKNSKPIWGYDLANEPVEGDVADDCDTWQELAERTARAIRAIDPQRTIIVEPADWGGPAGLDHLVPLTVSNVIYSVHMYLPHAFTHQNVHGKTPEYLYPGVIQGKHWDKAELERALQPAIDFQKRYNVHLYIGEFSAIRWAPDDSAARYLRDVIDLFEKHEWDWSYHAFREWSGWSVEHGPDRSDTRPSAIPTTRQQMLREWFAKNQKPRW